ncbi:alpha-2-macroglobulin [Rhodopirellula sp. JC737]|nr:alpha-2-macroglobulin [Rhodopirellula sp. JC737]
MRQFRIVFSVIVVSSLLLGLLYPPLRHSMAAESKQDAKWRTEQFEAADQALKKGLPKTALEHYDAIVPAAIAESDHDDALFAMGMRASLKGQLEGGGAEERILQLQQELQSAPEGTKPLLQALLAEWFYSYQQQNQWRFRNRTEVETQEEDTTPIKSADDLKTWSAQRIIRHAGSLFDAALAESQSLKDVDLESIQRLVNQGSAPESYRPTVYDFLVMQAVDHFVDAHSIYSGPIERFELEANSPVLDSVDKFLAWEIPELDAESPLRRATILMQEWVAFRKSQSADNPDAYLDADWTRLMFADQNVVSGDKDDRVQTAVKRFMSEHRDHEISARASFKLAQMAMSNEDFVLAHQLASDAVRLHRDSFGGRQCAALIEQIESPELNLSTEGIWNPELNESAHPKIEISYKNVTRVHFKLLKLDFDRMLRSGRAIPNEDRYWLESFADAPVEQAWSVDLKATEDYQTKIHRLDAPSDLSKGPYLLVASGDKEFSDQENYLACNLIWVSELALVTEGRWNQDSLEGYVLDGASGEPVSEATVEVYRFTDEGATRNNRNNGYRYQSLPSLSTDRDGRFELKGSDQHNLLLVARNGKHRLPATQHHSLGHSRRPPALDANRKGRTVFFTDRAIYRPGQTLRFKAIATTFDQQENHYATHNRQAMKVQLIDPNNQVVDTLDLKTNDRGSCHGSFQLPTSGLTGQMRLVVREFPAGSATVRVEEYKRPKFEVKLEAPSDPVRLEESVTVTGKATAYTGAAINDAVVRYTVVREVRYPIWWGWRCWWIPTPPSNPQTIVQGETTTDELGRFQIDFDAVPDASVDRESEPTFRYLITADVVDTTGETRSDNRTVTAGYTTLAARMNVENPDWLTSNESIDLKVQTTSLDGEAQTAEVKIELWSLKAPDEIAQPLWGSSPLSMKDDVEGQVRADDINSWPLDELQDSTTLTTDASGRGEWNVSLKKGHYRAVLSAVDSAGNSVSAILPLRVIDPDADHLGLPLPSLFVMPKSSLEPGETFEAIWGTGYESARALVEVEHRGKLLQRYWTAGDTTQVKIRQAIDESMRGGFIVRVMMLQDNRLHLHQQYVDVPWTNKQWTIRWERFVSKLKPGAEETWTAVIEPNGSEAEAQQERVMEMVATLYDASLDVFAKHQFMSGFNMFYRDRSYRHPQLNNNWEGLRVLSYWARQGYPNGDLSYADWVNEFRLSNHFGRPMPMARGMSSNMLYAEADMAMADGAVPASAPMMKSAGRAAAGAELELAEQAADDAGPPAETVPDIDLSGIPPRKNLNETAFFFPELIADENGVVKMKFTMPEALTRWQLLGFAHGADLASGTISGTAVTSKDVMVQPNPPRTLREGDEIELTVKVSNQSASMQSGVVALNLSSAATGESVDEQVGNSQPKQSFEIPAGQSKTFSWRISVPDGIGYLVYKAVGSTGRLSDGEEGYLPVLTRRVLVHESISLPIDGAETKTFTLPKLLQGKSSTLKSESLTVQMTSNPAWYAVMALPYLMEYPHECSEQTFHRLYANLLARHIATSDPRIERVFQQWRNQPKAAGRETLDSPLAQNEDLKSIALSETPWVLQSQSESEARRNVGILFDTNRVNDQADRLTRRLLELQKDDGSFAWFDGGPANDTITMIIVTGFGRLNHLGVDVDMQAAMAGLKHLDEYAKKLYDRIKAEDRGKVHVSPTIAMLLYGRSFYLDQPVAVEHKEAVEYWTQQLQQHWLSLPSRMSQGHAALALHRSGRLDAAREIVASLIERSVVDEQGMHWNDPQSGWWWYQAPIETQAMMIEVLDEVAGDAKRVEQCQAWLLRQKETQSWETTKSTADAVYALLLRGTDKLASNEVVDVAVGQTDVPKASVEAGTGFYQHRFSASEITPQMGSIRVKKTTPGIAWGGVHWQYFENIENITPHDGTPLQVEKQLFVVRATDSGPVLRPVGDEPVRVGDELVSRLIIRSDRDMEFLHLRDHRGSGTEPVNVLSQYRSQDALGYYQSTRDAAEHFFIGYLRKGTYVLESRCRVQLRGNYQTGMASIESMYAPQYNSHSESHALEVK